MQRVVRRFLIPRRAILPGWAILACTLSTLHAAPPANETIFESPDLRIYRALDRDGRAVVVLTNIDQDGNFFPGRRQEQVAERPAALPESCAAGSGPAPAPPGAEEPKRRSVRVRVGGDDGSERPAREDEIEIGSDGTGDTTIVININNPAPAPSAAPILAYPVLAFGGLPGPFRYPDHLHFLGYGHGVGSPSLFSGLGLNAGNHFGLKTGTTCENGYDCLFGPLHEHP